MHRSDRFKLRSGPPLLWSTWDDQSVVFDSISDCTHLLDLVAAEGLRCLECETLDLEALADRLGRRLDQPRDAALRKYAEQLLDRFDTLGLVERAEPDPAEMDARRAPPSI